MPQGSAARAFAELSPGPGPPALSGPPSPRLPPPGRSLLLSALPAVGGRTCRGSWGRLEGRCAASGGRGLWWAWARVSWRVAVALSVPLSSSRALCSPAGLHRTSLGRMGSRPSSRHRGCPPSGGGRSAGAPPGWLGLSVFWMAGISPRQTVCHIGDSFWQSIDCVDWGDLLGCSSFSLPGAGAEGTGILRTGPLCRDRGAAPAILGSSPGLVWLVGGASLQGRHAGHVPAPRVPPGLPVLFVCVGERWGEAPQEGIGCLPPPHPGRGGHHTWFRAGSSQGNAALPAPGEGWPVWGAVLRPLAFLSGVWLMTPGRSGDVIPGQRRPSLAGVSPSWQARGCPGLARGPERTVPPRDGEGRCQMSVFPATSC